MAELPLALSAAEDRDVGSLADASSCLLEADRIVASILRSLEDSDCQKDQFVFAALCGVAATINTNIVMVEKIRALTVKRAGTAGLSSEPSA